MLKIAINGYGRIGRNIVRIIFEKGLQDKIQLVAINDLGDAETLTHLTRFDSTFGRFSKEVKIEDNFLEIDGQKIELLSVPDVANLPWHNLDVDVVLECTGRAKSREAAKQHLTAGAKAVLLSHPAEGADLTVVYGVNHEVLADAVTVSNASCTTSCPAPLAKRMNDSLRTQQAFMTTIQAYTTGRSPSHNSRRNPHRSRASAHSISPTSTGPPKSLCLVSPERSRK